jgi:hypothetical protein
MLFAFMLFHESKGKTLDKYAIDSFFLHSINPLRKAKNADKNKWCEKVTEILLYFIKELTSIIQLKLAIKILKRDLR